MPISQDARIFALLYGKAVEAGFDRTKMAMLVDSYGKAKAIAVGVGRPPTCTRTAIVNVIQHAADNTPRALKGGSIYTSEQPTEMDIGMARRNNVAGIYTTYSGSITWIATTLGAHKGPPGDAVTAVGNVVGPAYRAPKTATGWLRPTPAHNYDAELQAYYRALSHNATGIAIGKAIKRIVQTTAGLAALNFAVPASGANLGVSTIGLSQVEKDALFLSLAHELVAKLWGTRADTDATRLSEAYVGWNIGCVLVDAAGNNILGWGVNTNKSNLTRHGEVNLIQYYEQRISTLPLPDDAVFYTTLEPCQMCAGMLASIGTRNKLRVIWGQVDVNIAGSALQRGVLGASCLSAQAAGVHNWSDVLQARQTQVYERTLAKVKADIKVLTDGGASGLDPRVVALKKEQTTLERYRSIQTTAFLGEGEAAEFFGRSRQRRALRTMQAQLTDIRETLELYDIEFSPGAVRAAQSVFPRLVNAYKPILDLSDKLTTFVNAVGVAMARR